MKRHEGTLCKVMFIDDNRTRQDFEADKFEKLNSPIQEKLLSRSCLLASVVLLGSPVLFLRLRPVEAIKHDSMD